MRNIRSISKRLLILLAAATFISGQVFSARAAILFQDDTFGDIPSDTLRIGSNDAGAVNTTIQFGNDVTASENGNILWNITTNTFNFDHSLDITGGVTASGTATFNGATNVNGAATIGDGGDDISIDSNDWDISAAGAGSGFTGFSSSGTVTSSGTLSVTGVGNIGDGGDDININSNDWDISSAGVASGFTGLTSTGSIDLTAATSFRHPQGASDPATCSVGQFFYNTTINANKICTATNTWSTVLRNDTSQSFTSGTLTFNAGTTLTGNGAINFTAATSFRPPQGAADPGTCSVGQEFYNTTSNSMKLCTSTNTWTVMGSANGADLLDGVDSTQFLRSDTSDNFTSGTLTTDNGTTFTINGIANIGDGGDNVAVNTSSWDVSSAGVGSGFTGFTSTGTVNFSGAGSMRLREVADEATAACTTVNEIVLDTAEDRVYVCTVTGTPGTWVGIRSGEKGSSLIYIPEYPDAVASPDGTNNSGTLFADRDGTNFRNYYQWNAAVTTLQDMDIVVSVQLPSDFASFQATPIQLQYRTDDVDVADAQIDLTVLDTANAAVTTSGATDLNSTTWASASVTFSGTPTFTAGERITVSMKLQSRKDGGVGGGTPRNAYIGPLILNYNRQ